MGREYTRSFGSIGQVSPYGPLILFDDFESTLFKWIAVGGGAGSLVDRFVTDAKDGLACMRILTDTAPAIGQEKMADRNVYGRPSGIYTVEAEFKILNANTFDKIQFTITETKSGLAIDAGFSYDDVNNKMQFINIQQGLADFPNNAIELIDNFWHRIQFSFNINTLRYLSLVVDGSTFDVNELAVPTFGTGALSLKARVRVRLGVATQSTLLTENFMIKEGAPDF